MPNPYDASVKRGRVPIDSTTRLHEEVEYAKRRALESSIRDFTQWQWEVDERIALLNRRVAQLEDVAVHTLHDETDEE